MGSGGCPLDYTWRIQGSCAATYTCGEAQRPSLTLSEWVLGICGTAQVSLLSLAQLVKNLPAMQENPGFDSWVGKIPWRRDRLPTLVFWPGESPQTEEPGGLQSVGSQRVGHD